MYRCATPNQAAQFKADIRLVAQADEAAILNVKRLKIFSLASDYLGETKLIASDSQLVFTTVENYLQ